MDVPSPTRRHRTRQRLAQTDGFTLPELLIGIVLFLLVTTAILTPIVVAQRVQVSNTNYDVAQQTTQAGLDSMVAEIRQAWSILSTSPNSVEMDVNLGGTAYHVLYECDIPQPGTGYRECVRVQSAAGSALPPLSSGAPIITNLTNGTVASPVFSFAPDAIAPYYMTATVVVPASGGSSAGEALQHTLSFSDGALMRNLNIGN